MAFRFSKRIKIAPGVSLNVGKRGVSTSVGPRGAKVSVGRQGVYGSASIPGTGISFREKLSGKSASTKPRTRHRTPDKLLDDHLLAGNSFPTRLTVREDGTLDIRDQDDDPLTPEEINVLKRRAGDALREGVEEQCRRLNEDLEALAAIHRDTLSPRDSPVFTPRPFMTPEPRAEEMESYAWWSRLWPAAKRRIDAANRQRLDRHASAMAEWEAAARAFQAREEARRLKEQSLMWQDIDMMSDVLKTRLGSIPWPRETSVSFDFGDDASTVAIDIELPREADLPDIEYRLAAKQLKVTPKKVSDTKRRQIYRDYVHGVALRVLGEIYHYLPGVQLALVSAYTAVLDEATGHEEDTYLYSVLVDKERWRMINFSALERVEPVATLEGFKLRRKMTKTGIFTPIEPLGVEDMDLHVANTTS